MLTTPIFTRIISKEDYGSISIYNSWLTMITIFATFELSTGVFNKAMIKYEDDKDGYASSTLALSSLLTVGLYILYVLLREYIDTLIGLNTFVMTLMFIDIFFSQAMSFWSIRQRFDYNYRSVVLLTLVSNILATCLSIWLVISNSSHIVEYKIVGTVLVHVLIYSVVYFVIFHRGKRIYSYTYWKYALTYNIPLIPHYLSQQILNQSDRIMIGKMCGNDYAATYSVAYQLGIVMNLFTNAIHASFSPWVFRHIKEKRYQEIGNITLLITMFFSGLCFLFSLFAPELILILGGKSYYEAIWVIPPVAMSVVFNVMYSLIGNIAFYFEKTKFIMVGTTVSALMNLVLNYIFIHKYGFIAAGYTTLFCYILYAVLHYEFMKYICKENDIEVPYNGKLLWTIAIISVILSLLANVLYQHFCIRYSVIVIMIILAIASRKKIMSVIVTIKNL